MSPTARGSPLAVAFCLVLAGCTTGGVPGNDDTPTSTPTVSPTETRAPSTPTEVPYTFHTFDHGGIDHPILEGGIVHDDPSATRRYYVTTIETRAAAERFNRSLLSPETRGFIANTSFDAGFLVAVQAFPAASVPDYRVESVRRPGAGLRIAINDSSEYGTDDVTVETVLVRVSGPAVDTVTVTTQDGVVFDTTTGVRTMTPQPSPTPEANAESPFDFRLDAGGLTDFGGTELGDRGPDRGDRSFGRSPIASRRTDRE